MADHVHVLGIGADGPATGDGITARPAAVFGSRRLLGAVDGRWPDAPRHELLDLPTTLDAIERLDGEVVVVASGDPGFLGIARRLTDRLGIGHVSVHPAVSAVSAAFAHAGVPWDDARVVSAHGRDPHAALAVCQAHHKVAVLTEPRYGPRELGNDLLRAGCGPRTVTVVERLGHDDERVRQMDLDGLARLDDAGDPNVVVLLDPSRPQTGTRLTLAPPPDVPDGWALSADAFDHREGLISKPEVRALVLAHLAPAPGRRLWDVGAGSGSVAIECARFGAAVHAVESDAEQLALLRRNLERHAVAVHVVDGEAPSALERLPDPDAVFIGGGGAALPRIIDDVAARTRDRVAVALATVERVQPTVDRLRQDNWDAGAQLVQVSDLLTLGDGHRLAPRNPVFLVLAERRS